MYVPVPLTLLADTTFITVELSETSETSETFVAAVAALRMMLSRPMAC